MVGRQVLQDLLDPAQVACVAYFHGGQAEAEGPFHLHLPTGPIRLVLGCQYNQPHILSFAATEHVASSGIFTRLNTSTETVS